MGSKQINFRADDVQAALLSEICKLERRSLTDAINGLIADGLKYRMLNNSPVPLADRRIHNTKDEAMPLDYLHFLEAIKYQTGIDAQSKFRFAQYPNSEYWHSQGLDGKWTILYHTMSITEKGIDAGAGVMDME